MKLAVTDVSQIKAVFDRNNLILNGIFEQSPLRINLSNLLYD